MNIELLKEQIKQEIRKRLIKLGFLESEIPEIKIWETKDKSHGDLTSNIAMVLGKKFNINPQVLAFAVILLG